jgi:pimeloyl-ACP methyl ester carboxylesterase
VSELTYESTLRELSTPHGVLRYHEAGDGPPLLMLHGSGPGVTGWRNFGDNLPRFAKHFRCLVLEFPGFGVSDTTDQHPMVAALPAVGTFLDGLGLDQVDIIGNSMGGGVAVRFAIEQPARVRRMVTVGGIGRNVLSPAPGEGINLLVDFTENPTRDRLVSWLRSMVYDQSMVTEELIEQRWQQATAPETLEVARRMYSRAAIEATFARNDDSTNGAPGWAQFDQVRAKTLITWGRDDRVSPMDQMLIPLRMIPDVQVHIFARCGHWAMIEQKAAWESTVETFLLAEDEVPA